MSTSRTLESVALSLALSLATVGCGGNPAEVNLGDASDLTRAEHEVVYGTDNRQDVYAHPDATLRARAQQSTVALMSASTINASNPNNVTFYSDTLGSAYSLCSTERFRNDPTAAFCSGTLIDDDLVLTAGHCVTSSRDCADTRFVFNYYRTSSTALKTVTTADIFSCASIVARKETSVNGQEIDYAIIRLDRPATPRFSPAPVRTTDTAMSVGQNVAVIGSGSGIPFKIDSGGKVRDARASIRDYFEASTDTFGGNSGSGVYETNSHTVVGILVRGDTDYRAKGSCNVVNVCSENGCAGEGVTYVRRALQDFCAANTSARLCGSGSTSQQSVENLSGSVAQNGSQNFGPFQVAPGTTFEVVMSGSGDPDLYVRFGSAPTTSAYDCRPYKAGANETCSLTVPAGASAAYVMVRGYSASTFNLRVSYTSGNPGTPSGPTVKTVSFSGSVSANESRSHGPLTVVPGSTFSVVMSGSGDPDLYVRFGAAPTTSTWDCRPYLSGAAEQCNLIVPVGQTQAYLMVRGYSAASYELSVTYTSP